MKKGRLSRNIFIVIFSSTILLFVLMSFYIVSVYKKNLVQQDIQEIKSLNEQVSLQVNSFILKQQVMLETFIDTNLSSLPLQDTSYNYVLTSFAENMSSVNDIVLLDSLGHQKGYFGPYYKFDYKDILEQIKKTTLKEKNIFLGGLKKNPFIHKLIFTFALPVSNLGQIKEGALLFQINMQSLEGEILPLISKDDFVLIFTKNGFLIFSSEQGISTEASKEYDKDILKILNLIKDKKLPAQIDSNLNGFISQNELSSWYIYTARKNEDKSHTYWFLYVDNWQILTLCVVAIFILAFLIALYISGTIENPVRDMTKAINIIEKDSKEPLPSLPVYNNEIGDLAMHLARMLDTIKIKFDLLAEQQHDLEELNQSLELRVGSRTKELKTALNELIKKERLAAIGQMASIVSHEIKNPLAVISNSIYLIKARLGENIEPKILKNINIIEGEIKQANGIIEEILGYARSREQILNVIDLTLYAKEILSSYPVPSNIKVETSFYAEPLYVKIDTEEMKQAIRNIMGNAFEVMPEGGTFVVKTKLEQGKALLSFRDSGPGIPQEIQNKIFTPFFTTKARGTGLGLAVVKKVAIRNKAEIVLTSQVGKGTKITLLFNREEKQ